MISPKYLKILALVLSAVAVCLVLGSLTGDPADAGEGRTERTGAAASSDPSSPWSAVARPNRKGGPRRPSPPGGGESGERSAKLSDRQDEPQASAGDPVDRSDPARLVQRILEQREKGVRVFDDNFELSQEVAEALGLSDSEYQSLNQTLQGTLEEISELRADKVEVRQRSDSQLFLKVRSFGEEGAAVQASLEQSLRQQLGDDRYASFMLLAGDDLAREYSQFGEGYQTISFNIYDSQNDGARRVRIVDRLHVPQGNGEWAVIENKDNYESMPEVYAPYFDLANSNAPNPIPPGMLPQPAPIDTASD
jgi:hypothetical protein